MMLTDRDFELLCYLGSHGVATAEELTKRFFPTYGSFKKRMCALRKEDLIETVLLSRLKEISQKSFLQAAHILDVPQERLRGMKIYRLAERLRKDLHSSAGLAEVKMWKHQVQLGKVLALLETLLPGATILTDPEVRSELAPYRLSKNPAIPDLVVRDGERTIAVEVERNAKNKDEYREKFNYYEDSSYTHVLYFCETDVVFQKVVERAARYHKVGVAKIVRAGLVYQEFSGFRPIEAFLGIAA